MKEDLHNKLILVNNRLGTKKDNDQGPFFSSSAPVNAYIAAMIYILMTSFSLTPVVLAAMSRTFRWCTKSMIMAHQPMQGQPGFLRD